VGKADAAIQLGMLGVPAQLEDTHVVAAHTRVLASGEEVFVGEHVRWNRGRSAGPSPARRRIPDGPSDDQLGLFASVAAPPPPPSPARAVDDEAEVEASVPEGQLSLWERVP